MGEEQTKAPTPGLWRVDRENVGEGRIITDANGVKVASTSIVVSGVRSIDKAEAIANAAHIVRCVNAHPEMLTALRSAGELIERLAKAISDATYDAFDGDTTPLVAFANEIDEWTRNGVLASYAADIDVALKAGSC